jgi:8-oxo-dGTP diphosphatase
MATRERIFPKEILEGIKMINVVAALIWDKDKFLICKRPATKARPLLWEFVGGKVESGETNEEALARECYEELDINLNIGNEFTRVTHGYPDVTVNLILFNATILSGVPTLKEHKDIRWIKPTEISNFEFCPADKHLLERIIKSF